MKTFKILMIVLLGVITLSCECDKEDVQPDYVPPKVPKYMKMVIRNCDNEVVKTYILDQFTAGEFPIGLTRETCKGLHIVNFTYYGKIVFENPLNDEFSRNVETGYPTLIRHDRDTGLEINLIDEIDER